MQDSAPLSTPSSVSSLSLDAYTSSCRGISSQGDGLLRIIRIPPVVFESSPLCSNHPHRVRMASVVFEWPLPCSSHDRCALACPTAARLTPPHPPAARLAHPPCRLTPQCPCHLACPPPACLTPPPPPARFTPPHPTAGLISPRCVLLLHFDLAPRHCLNPPLHRRLFLFLSRFPLPPRHHFLFSSSSSRPSSSFVWGIVSSWCENQRR